MKGYLVGMWWLVHIRGNILFQTEFVFCYQDVTSQEAFDRIQENHGNPDFIILDVRTSLEFHDRHIEGALNIDVNLPSFSEELEQLDRNATYLVYCRTGNRSRTALRIMDDLGFTRVYHLTNGITEWVDAGLPVNQ